MYNYGSEARELEYGNFVSSFVTASEEAKKNAEKEIKIEKMKRTALKCLAVAAVLLTVVMVREAQIDKLCGQITNKEGSIYELNAIITEKEMQLSGQMDVTLIENEAVSRLNMVKPSESDYVPITVNKLEGGEVLMEESTHEEGLAAFINKAKILLEYLY